MSSIVGSSLGAHAAVPRCSCCLLLALPWRRPDRLRCRVCPRPPIEPPRLRRHPFLPPRGCPTLPPAPLRAAARPADRTSSRRRLPLAPTSTRDLRDSVCRCRLALHQPPPAPALANVHHYAGGAALCRPTPTAVGPSAGLVPPLPLRRLLLAFA